MKENRVNVLEELLKNGIGTETRNNHDWSSRTALVWAAMGGFTYSVRLLLEYGALIESMDGNCFTSIVYAAKSGHVNTVNVLIEKGANIEMSDNAEYCPSGFVENQKNVFWEKRVYLYNDRGGHTPLMNAVIGRHKQITKLLLNAGADYNKTDPENLTALGHAKRLNYKDMVELIQDYIKKSKAKALKKKLKAAAKSAELSAAIEKEKTKRGIKLPKI